MRSRRRLEQGYILGFVVVLAAGLLGFAGLADDGGRALSARLRAMDEAQAAARAASERVDLPTFHATGRLVLAHDAAVAAAQQYLAATGDAGTVAVNGDLVQVTVTIPVPTQILGIMGIRSLTVRADGDAHADQRATQGVAP